ncbi:uncharacterized protein LOC7493874 isoform X3 [Populus trichocarpa]|uniref:uncharacterized protein LOC7493874 isoform X3 n=1 Tax=Populus trichocarpa TaxID=3694 RepID=UPI000D18A37D|nr:uncharacterized protein LOC7493874 isoform X3 [Populus trichocarpa]|eukprot:XP_024439697.1 uncharacterized protein LOC7493874 isoform X3 [Populus trichocarpa]
MGQVLDKFHGHVLFAKHHDAIWLCHMVWFTNLCSDINKRLPGPHFDPPSKEQVRAMMQACDMNLDGELNHEEFVKFMQQLTADTFIVVSQGLIITLVVAPTVAMATKKATEGVPGVGKVVRKLPTSIYASLVTLAIVWFQTGRQDVD